jgi:spore coat polysaccharide biosynthesis predicted glycosyltransferase SpsG
MYNSSKIRILFRVDGGSEQATDEGKKKGMGHIARCLNLANEFSNHSKTETIFIMSNYPKGVNNVRDAGFIVKTLPINISITEELEIIDSYLQKSNPDAIICDMLDTEEQYISCLRRTGAVVINVDDNGPGRRLADVLVYVLVKEPKDIKSASSTQLSFIGPSYIALKEDFEIVAKKRKEIREKCETILVTFGGSDPKGLSIKAIKALEKMDQDFRTTIVIGPAFTRINEFEKVLKSAKKEYLIKSNVSNMVDLMYNADIAITSGGVTVYELAAVGTPGIVLCQNEHEDTNVFERYGTVIKLGLGEVVSENEIVNALQQLIKNVNLRQTMSKKGEKLVDGKGTKRIVDRILTLINKKQTYKGGVR